MRGRRRGRRILLWAAGLLLLALAAVGGNTLAHYRGWLVARQDPETLSALLRPAWAVRLPPGKGPFPTGILFSGCDGPRDSMERWAAMLNREGWAAVIVDSHGPRGYDGFEIWRLICAGQLLMGAERAGDVLVAIRDVRRSDFARPGRIVLLGASHGGWAVMDLLALAARGALPHNLAALPQGLDPDRPLAGVAGQILLYPYCGPPGRGRDGWTWPSASLFLLSRDDAIAPAADCEAIAGKLAAKGMPVETVVFPGVTHGFDQEERAAFSTLEFDAAATEAALAAGARFLRELPAAPGG